MLGDTHYTKIMIKIINIITDTEIEPVNTTIDYIDLRVYYITNPSVMEI